MRSRSDFLGVRVGEDEEDGRDLRALSRREEDCSFTGVEVSDGPGDGVLNLSFSCSSSSYLESASLPSI